MKTLWILLGLLLAGSAWSADAPAMTQLSELNGMGKLTYGLDGQGGLDVSLAVQTEGWVGFGLGSPRMNGATIFMGYVKDGQPVFSQQTGAGHSHQPAEDLLWDTQSVTLDHGITTLKFHIPAAKLPFHGTSVPFIAAYSGAANLTQYHDLHDTGTLELGPR